MGDASKCEDLKKKEKKKPTAWLYLLGRGFTFAVANDAVMKGGGADHKVRSGPKRASACLISGRPVRTGAHLLHFRGVCLAGRSVLLLLYITV